MKVDDPLRSDGREAEAVDEAAIEAAILAAVRSRAPRTICPSEVARALVAAEVGWRALMPQVRAAADRLQRAGAIVATRRGEPVETLAAKGPIRLALAPREAASGA